MISQSRCPRAPRAQTLPAPFLLLLALLTTSPAAAEMCTLDVVPAATLLVPYFEASLDETNRSTVLLLQNSSPDPALVNLTLWTDWAQPTISINIFLTGFDRIGYDLKRLFTVGELPITADADRDPADTISPHGDHPERDGSFPDCDLILPFDPPNLSDRLLEYIRNAHTGRPSDFLQGACAGADRGDGIARGYVTIDNVNRCTVQMPQEPGYFAEVDPVASDVNQLYGDFFFLRGEISGGRSLGSPMVHLEADPGFSGVEDSGLTFYGSFTGGLDHREPLGGVWDVPFEFGAAENLTSEWIVWRDPTHSAVPRSYACESGPDWAPLPTPPITCWNHQEDVEETCLDGDCFPLATERRAFGLGGVATSFDQGYCRVGLSAPDADIANDVDFPGDTVQSWMGAIRQTDLAQGGFMALQLEDAGELVREANSRLFEDDFESGTLGAWASSTP
ncbi:MAG: hypothetical protein AAF725_10610 [Acidobacteriota bacterium]